jgi:hypothetical protein
MCALTALLGTGVLVLAHHPALFSVGLTALLGISFSLAGDAVSRAAVSALAGGK